MKLGNPTKYSFYLFTGLVACLLVIGLAYLDRLSIEKHHTDSIKNTQQHLNQVHNRLIANLQNNIQIVRGLPSLFVINPDLSQQDYEKAIKNLFNEHSQLRNIAAAPDMVIKYMYPIKGNEAAIGLDYRKVPDQFEAVEKARTSRQLVLAGPLQLKQGGVGLITRIPVFINNEHSDDDFWGIIAAVIDVDKFFQHCGLLGDDLPIDLAIRGKDGTGAEGDVFFGDAALFNNAKATTTIEIPNGSWYIAAQPKGGWMPLPDNIWTQRVINFTVALLIFLIFITYLRSLFQASLANLRFHQLIEDAPIPYAMNNDKSEITYLNKAFTDEYGYTIEDIPTLTEWWLKAYPDPDYRQYIEDAWASYIKLSESSSEKLLPMEATIQCRDGSMRTILASVAYLSGDRKDEHAVVLYDITDRKVAEEQYQLSSRVFQAAHEGIMITNIEGDIVDVNPTFCTLTGFSREDVIGKKPNLLNSEKHTPEFYNQIWQSVKSQGFWQGEMWGRKKDGTTIATHLTLSAILDSTDKPQNYISLFTDITHSKQQSEMLHQNEKRMRLSQVYGGIGTWEADLVNDKQTWSDTCVNLLGFPHLDNPSWSDFLNVVHKDDRAMLVEETRAHIEEGQKYEVEYRIYDHDKQLKWMRSAGQVERDGAGNPVRMLGTVQDITPRKKAEEKIRLSSRIFNETHEGIIVTDVHGIISDVNPAFTTITGYSRDEIIGRNPRVLNSGRHPPEFYVDMWQSLTVNGHWQGEVWNRKKNGNLYAELLSLSKILDDSGNLLHYVGLFTDITQSKQQQEKLELMAHYDVLTKLPNRVLFADRYTQAVAHSKRTETMLALCFIDLDNFKPVNDTYGHDIGDRLLIEVAERIQLHIRQEDTVSRQGGDEFILLLGNVKSVTESAQLLERILHSIAQPYLIEKHAIEISASAGMTLYPLDDADIDTLIRHADQAMYQAKLAGRNGFQLFNADEDKKNILKLHRLQEIEYALKNDQLSLYYQPKVNMKTGEVFGVEALIRWIHPDKGIIPPLEFLPIITGTVLELRIGDWVVDQALKQLDQWQKAGIHLEVSVNISSHHLQSEQFIDNLDASLANYPDIDSKNLQIEILESSVLSDLSTISSIISTCIETLGIQVALDDFGTGYSSLAHLRNLPADTLKIDQSFVRDILDDPNDYSIIDGVIGLADAFDRKIIAEGVETTEHGLMLLLIGCEQAQGYGIARPMPANDILAWLSNYTPNQQWLACDIKSMSFTDIKMEEFRLGAEWWFKLFEKNIQSLPEKVDRWPIMNRNKCHHGVWIKRSRNETLFSKISIDRLDDAHDKMHQIAEELLTKYQLGHIDETKNNLPKLKSAYEKLQRALYQLN